MKKMNYSTNKVQVSYSVELLQSNFPGNTNSLTLPRLRTFSLTFHHLRLHSLTFPGLQKFQKSGNLISMILINEQTWKLVYVTPSNSTRVGE